MINDHDLSPPPSSSHHQSHRHRNEDKKKTDHHTKHRIQHQSIYSCVELCSISGHTYIRPHAHTHSFHVLIYVRQQYLYHFQMLECIIHILYVCWLWVFRSRSVFWHLFYVMPSFSNFLPSRANQLFSEKKKMGERKKHEHISKW